MPLDSSTAVSYFGIECWQEMPPTVARLSRTGVSETYIHLRTLTANVPWLTLGFLGGIYEQGGSIFYYPPALSYDYAWMWADSIEVSYEAGQDPITGQPQGYVLASNNSISAKYALMKIRFCSVPYSENGQSVVTLEFGNSIISWPSNKGVTGLQWVSSNNPIPQNAAPIIPVPQVAICLTVRNQPDSPPSVINQLMRTCNSATFLGWPAGYVSFVGCFDTIRGQNFASIANIAGQPFVADQQWKFLAQSYSWNQFINPDKGTSASQLSDYLDSIQTAPTSGAGNPFNPYTPYDYNQLFTF